MSMVEKTGKNAEESRRKQAKDRRIPVQTIECSLREHGCQISSFLGEGAFSEVYRVRELKTGRFLACKVSWEQKIWEKESRLLSRVQHPLFPAFSECWQSGALYYLLMEYVSGENLAVLLRRRGKFSQTQAVRIGLELSEGLAFLEEQPEAILFRDLKPENIIIREDGKVKLIDFGCACLEHQKEMTIAGTPGYAAPEQLVQGKTAGTYSDVYAFGRLLHYMLTGDNPCLPPGKKPTIRVYDRRFSRSLEQLVEECVCTEISERLPDMRRVLHRLQSLAEENFGRHLFSEISAFCRAGSTVRYTYHKNVLKSSHMGKPF